MLNKQGLTEEEFLALYDAGKYERPSVTVDMLIFTVKEKKLKLLMIKRGDHPFIGQWALPGGFVNIDEDLETAARRELLEETSLDNIYMEQVHTWGDVNRDPRTRIITTAYMALADSKNLKPKADDDAAEAEWFEVKCFLESKTKDSCKTKYIYKLLLSNEALNLSAEIEVIKTKKGRAVTTERNIKNTNNIASDHCKIIEHALEVLRSKLTASDIMCNLLEDEFTLEEIKNVYEIISGRSIDEKELLNKLNHIILPSFKPTYYKFNPEWEETLQ